MHRESAHREFTERPAIWMGLAFIVALVLAGGVLAVDGTAEKSLRLALRITARWSFVLFWLAYAGGAVGALFGLRLGRRGRLFGLGFAAAHLVHVGLVGWLCGLIGRLPLTGLSLALFSLALGCTYILAGMSFGRLGSAFGPRVWHGLRLVGMNTILVAFGFDFVGSLVRHAVADHSFGYWVLYLPFAAMTVAAPLLVTAARIQQRVGTRALAA